MVTTPSREHSLYRDRFRDLLESNYQKYNFVHLTSGSVVPLLKNSIWLVVRGIVKLGAITVHGDELLLGFAGPNQPFGESLSTVEAYEAVALSDCDLLCITTNDVEQSPQLALAMMHAITARHSQVESLLALLGLRRVESVLRFFSS